MLDPLAIICVSEQVLRKIVLFVTSPPSDGRRHWNNHKQSPPGPERKRRADHYGDQPCVHRMADNRVRPGRNDRLITPPQC